MFPKIKNPKDKPSYAQKLKHNLNETHNNPPPFNQNLSPDDNLKLDLMNAHELFNALKIIKETLNEFPKIIEIKNQSVNRPVSDSAEVDCASNNVSFGVANTSTVDPAPVAEDFNQVKKISMILETIVKAIPFVR
ncbi:hypothetical protein AVEN_113219-1 [Araneus ventricosus]|uniref:Uncharacterized protein n=1 Tax=Araneus ventricosus TaxID=182803 RepID=A0A4Y2WTD4_ARAVE|nr:hypothetical protein AVEN_113219-1 [Araneus ventricosus]